MRKTLPLDTLRADAAYRKGTPGGNALTLVDATLQKQRRGPMTAIEVEAPTMPTNLAEALDLAADKRPLVFELLQKAADAWAAMSPQERAAIGHIRYHFHESGAVVCQRIADPRKGQRRPLR